MIKKTFENQVLDTYWYESLKNKINKVAVNPKRVDDQLFHQINDVIRSKKSKFSSVEEKVKEMMERSGVNNFNSVKLSNKISKKAEVEENKIRLFEKIPEVKNTIKNIIDDSKGSLPLISILEKLKDFYSNDLDSEEEFNMFEDEALKKYIVQENLKVKSKPEKSNNLGKNHFKNETEDDTNNFLETIRM